MAIMGLISKDLSEPYSVYTYRYFIHSFPHLCILVRRRASPYTQAKREDKCRSYEIDGHGSWLKWGFLVSVQDKRIEKLTPHRPTSQAK